MSKIEHNVILFACYPHSETMEYELIRACRFGATEKVKDLISRGIDVNIMSSGTTALVEACSGGFTNIVMLLLGAEANADMGDEFGRTPIMFAAAYGFTDIVKILLRKGVDANKKDTNGNTALISAADHGCPDTLRLLLEAGVDPDVANNENETALFWAEQNRHEEASRILRETFALASQ